MMTQKAINSCLESDIPTKVVVVERATGITYKNAYTAYQRGEFNYNRYMNEMADTFDSDYIAFCNNDVVFTKDWAKKIIDEMEKRKINSASPADPDCHFEEYNMPDRGVAVGWQARKYLPGWCFIWTRKLYEKLGGLRETCSFWCSDNETVEQLKEANEQHMLCREVVVTHLGSVTLKKIQSPKKQMELTIKQAKKFNKKYNQNVLNIGK